MQKHTLYIIVEQAIRSFATSVEVRISSTEDDVYMAIRQVMRDNPDIFWFSHQWRFSQYAASVRFRYTFDQERCEKIKAQIDDVVQKDFKLSYVRTLPVEEKVMYVYKWIALYCNYDIQSAHNQTIYSVFVQRHSVCTGIAKAAQYLLAQLGIESRLVFGKMNNSELDSRHCWLLVNIEGRWYHFDPTFALPETEHLLYQCGVMHIQGDGFLFYNYFCVDTAKIKQSRTIEEENLLPICNESIDYTLLQRIEVTPSRNGQYPGLGCLLSDVGTTADIYIEHSNDIHSRRRTVAKVYREDPGHELLRKELIVMRECAGPHLLRAIDADNYKGILYMQQAMPLAELLASHYYKLTVKDFCDLLLDIASGLKKLLDHGIIYRDIHLNNIYLSHNPIDGSPIFQLGDFGSCTFAEQDGKYAGLTSRGGVGSQWFMAPETWSNGTFDERSAVYGVGTIAYYLLNDLKPPLCHDSIEEYWKLRMECSSLPLPSLLIRNRYSYSDFGFLFKSTQLDSSDRQDSLTSLMCDIQDFAYSLLNPYQVLIDGNTLGGRFSYGQNENFCSTCIPDPTIQVSNGEGVSAAPIKRPNNYATTCGLPSPNTYYPSTGNNCKQSNSTSFWSRIFGKKQKLQDVYSSVFAPAEVKKDSRMMVQVYLHLVEETDKVVSLAKESDQTAIRRDYIPLQTKLKTGDLVDVELNINGETLLFNNRKSLRWQGSFCKCAFDYLVPSNLSAKELSCSVGIYVNGAFVGEMLFYTRVANYPMMLKANVMSKPVQKLFISYSHNDLKSAEKIAKLYEGMDVDVFFDKHRLKSGYIYSEEIFNFIRTADTFVLCWSENAAQSEYVEKERKVALELAYPNCRPREYAQIRIKPYNIQPYATPPKDMIEHYHFEEL